MTIDIESFKKAGFTFEEIQDIIESEEEFERTGESYSLDEAFLIVRKSLFSKKEQNV